MEEEDYYNVDSDEYDTDDNEFVGVLHAIRAVPPEGVQKIWNMK